MEVTMQDARKTLKTLEKSSQLLHQQQITFINALERTREIAHDRIRPVRTLGQVRDYLDNNCNNSTDRRVLTLFLDVCADLAEFCIELESMQNDTRTANGLIEQTITLLNPTNDLSGLRAKHPHDVVNHLSCDEARNFYGGIVSIVPVVLDNIREAISRLERTQPRVEDSETIDRLMAIQRNRQRKAGNQGVTQNTGVQTMVSQGNLSARPVKRKKRPEREAKGPTAALGSIRPAAFTAEQAGSTVGAGLPPTCKQEHLHDEEVYIMVE